MYLPAQVIPPTVPLVLIVILAASCVVYWMLIRRWTEQRQWLALSDWAAENGFKLHGERNAVAPDVLRTLTTPPPRVLVSLHDPDTIAVQVETLNNPNPEKRNEPARWNLLVRKLQTPWPTTCLRPPSLPSSISDFYPAHTFVVMTQNERFTLYSVSSAAAKGLNRSSARALLPPDVSVVLTGENLIIDFSRRPFDALEIQRMDSLAEQLVAHLPLIRGEVG
jgi:hypothetical protein